MTLPAFDQAPEGVKGRAYPRNPECAVPDCDRGSREGHHIVRRSKHGKPFNWIRLQDDSVIGNVIGLCHEHHEALTSPVGGHRNAIRWLEDYGRFFWCDVLSDGRGGVEYLPGGELDPQPPTPDTLDEWTAPEEQESDICPSCGQNMRAGRRSARSAPSDPRPRKTWSITVPADSEDGALVLDTLVDDLAPVLGYESEPKLRYYVVARALVFAQQSKAELLAAMEGR